jgi:hypothetical protein
MFKRVAVIIGGVLVAMIVGLYAIGTAFAQAPAPPAASGSAPPSGPAWGPWGAAGGPWGPMWGRVSGGASIVWDALTKALGMTSQEIYAERAAGKTLADIAKSKGVSEAQLTDAILAAQKTAIDQAVKDKRLTQAQADWLLARMKANSSFMLSNPFTPPAGSAWGPRGGRGPGRGPWWGRP